MEANFEQERRIMTEKFNQARSRLIVNVAACVCTAILSAFLLSQIPAVIAQTYGSGPSLEVVGDRVQDHARRLADAEKRINDLDNRMTGILYFGGGLAAVASILMGLNVIKRPK